MDLKQRLTTLRRQRGESIATPDGATADPSTPVVTAQRLQRLYGNASANATTRRPPDHHVAQFLEGTLVADGLIVIERQFPLSHQHGQRRLDTLLTPSAAVSPVTRPVPSESLLFMDTETTGLAGGTGTLVFLLGLARIVGDTLCLRQFFLTAFRGERALLRTAKAWMEGADTLVTFNGKSFDSPLMATRYRLAGLDDPFATLQHLDLFHPTRRAFGSQWPDCRLQTAERRLLGFQRHDDLPAYLVPDVWFAFVRHGTMRQLPGILTHNRWDLLSLVTLLPCLEDAFIRPAEIGADVLAVARYWLQRGDEPTALAHLQAHQEQLSVTGQLALAHLYRRRQAWDGAVSIWRQLANQDCLEALERLAKYYEHVQGDAHAALALTRRLRHLERTNRQHAQREQRLMRKLSRP